MSNNNSSNNDNLQRNELELEKQLMLKGQPPEYPLNLLAEELLAKPQLPSRNYLLFKTVLLLAIAGSGATAYAQPAADYANNPDALLLSNDPLWSMVGVCGTSVAMYYFSTDIFFDYFAKEKFPQSLSTILTHVKSNWQRILEYLLIVSIALPSAMAPETTALYYNLDKSVLYLIGDGIVISIDNTILHFLPVALTFIFASDPNAITFQGLYCLPFNLAKSTLTCMGSKIYDAFRYLAGYSSIAHDTAISEQEKKLIQLSNYFKPLLIQQISKTFEQSLVESLEPNYNQLRYRINPSRLVNSIAQAHQSDQYKNGEELVAELILELSNDNKPNPLPKTGFGKAEHYAVISIGVILSVGALLGYVANSYVLMEELTNDPLTAFLIVALPSYFFLVLIAYLSEGLFASNYLFVKQMANLDYELPLEGKLYPKTYLGIMQPANLFLGAFSHPAAIQMYYDSFAIHNQEIKNIINFIVLAGIVPLCLSSVSNFSLLLLKQFTLIACAEESPQRQLLHYREKIQRFTHGISQLTSATVEHLLFSEYAPELFGLSGEKIANKREEIMGVDKVAVNESQALLSGVGLFGSEASEESRDYQAIEIPRGSIDSDSSFLGNWLYL